MRIILFNLFAIAAILTGIYRGLGIWIVSFRPQERGTPRTYGAVSCAGVAIFLIGWGVVLLGADHLTKPWLLVIVVTALLGWTLIPLGQVLVTRAAHRQFYLLPSELRTNPPSRQRLWILIVFAICFFVAALTIFFARK